MVKQINREIGIRIQEEVVFIVVSSLNCLGGGNTTRSQDLWTLRHAALEVGFFALLLFLFAHRIFDSPICYIACVLLSLR